MPGFEFRYRLNGEPPTIRNVAFHSGATLNSGDMLTFEDGVADLGATGDAALVGAAVKADDGERTKHTIRVVVDADAVYGVADGDAREEGATLDLAGATGEQTVGPSVNAEFEVVVDCSASEETLVRISVGRHRAPAEERRFGGELNSAIARALVRFHHEHFGRGPTKAQAFYRGNVIVAVLQEVMTKPERSLAEGGRTDAVLQMRQALQQTMGADLTATVEELTGCTVTAFMSSSDIDADMAAAVFVLDRPLPGEPGDPASDEGA